MSNRILQGSIRAQGKRQKRILKGSSKLYDIVFAFGQTAKLSTKA
jgi:hypothetical protein